MLLNWPTSVFIRDFLKVGVHKSFDYPWKNEVHYPQIIQLVELYFHIALLS